jgi:excisionase family DNA binding protein
MAQDRAVELMSLEETAAYLRISKFTLYTWRSRGDSPPGIRVGSFVRYRKSDVDEWLNSRKEA